MAKTDEGPAGIAGTRGKSGLTEEQERDASAIAEAKRQRREKWDRLEPTEKRSLLLLLLAEEKLDDPSPRRIARILADAPRIAEAIHPGGAKGDGDEFRKVDLVDLLREIKLGQRPLGDETPRPFLSSVSIVARLRALGYDVPGDQADRLLEDLEHEGLAISKLAGGGEAVRGRGTHRSGGEWARDPAARPERLRGHRGVPARPRWL